ncbi:amino acid adenylation domain-containing protein [Crocosphaera sp.]|uniref:amino acid adenylation domain-containing protein n=1 Tax=Crocosphaera sp. TaxID=2729996 RepID=UPI003F276191|nr:amino acid adenylation domain-containing protein [Crocosphaera sp.]
MPIKIGKPIFNTQAYILDQYLNLVPIGVVGELHLGGIGLARGYVNRPELTSEKFIPNPFSNDPEARLYKTGDLARYLPDGNIEFLGRIDHQVKIRGLRIELGEIETALSQHPQVEKVVVLVREDQPTKKRLVAYLIPQQQGKLSPQQLRSFLQQKLPEYMIPSAFILLENLPLTSNGKINFKALPEPKIERDEEIITPNNPTQEILTNIWNQLLGVEASISDNFFTLGGHSLLATQLMSRIRDSFNLEIPIKSLFENPTISQLSGLIDTQRNLDKSPPPIKMIKDTPEIPLSFAQSRLWFLEQLEGIGGVYNISSAFKLKGTLNIDILEKSFNLLCERQKSLRTGFQKKEGVVVQKINQEVKVNISLIDLQECLQQEQKIKQLIQEETVKPFNLEIPPLLRTILIKISNHNYILLLTIHHIISDGWSLGILTKELSKIYQSLLENQPIELPELAIQYTDFSQWQRQWLQGETLNKQINYWKKQLLGSSPILELPTNQPRPSIQTFSGNHQTFTISAEVTQELKKLSGQHGATLFMTLIAAFGVILSRYTHQEDVIIGSPIANRNQSEIEQLIRFFVNTLLLRIDVNNNPTFDELLKRVRTMALDAYTHQDIPFEKLVEELNPERNLSYTPLFQVLFALQNVPKSTLEIPEVTVKTMKIERSLSKFDLSLFMIETETALRGEFEYNADLFEKETIGRMIGHFETLLTQIITNSETQINKLSFLTPEEENQILRESNKTARDYPKDKSIHQLFEEQVKRTPKAIAIVYKNEKITYQELNNKANQLAYYLRKLGIKADSLVGICLDHSIEMLIGLLGVLKAGGAYVPLDPNYPASRLNYMLTDSGIELLLTQQKLLSLLSTENRAVVCLESNWETIEQQCQENLDIEICSDNLAYIIYTSGSTGKPKGVGMNHRPLINLILWQLKTSSAKYGTKTGQFTPISFDVSFQEIFSTWCSGGTLVVIPEQVRRDGTALLQFINEQSIERLFLPFVALELLSSSASNTEYLPSKLSELITAGEQLKITPTITNFLTRLPHCTLENQYGPTETHVVSAFKLKGSPNNWESLPPIGRPISNAEIYILDKYLQAVPIGVSGELYLGGDVLARGYLNRPKLTAQKFIPNPFGEGILYKTGDLAKYLADGNVQYIGRIDDQVKIRGFRIELAEIEAILNQHPCVQETVVIVKEYPSGNKQLVAYIISKSNQSPTQTELRTFLAKNLPGYMIPSVFVDLENFPLTPNGKIDRLSLKKKNLDKIMKKTEYIGSRNPIEKQLTDIWQKILERDPISINDNFFELGGSSLLAVPLLHSIEKKLGISLSLATLFQNPTIESLGKIVSQNTWEKSWNFLVPLQTEGSKRPLFAIHNNLSDYLNLIPYLGEEQPIYGLTDQNLLMKARQGEVSLEKLAESYLKELQLLCPDGPYFLIGFCIGGMVAWEMAQQLVAANQKVALLALVDTFAPGFRSPMSWEQRVVYHKNELLELGVKNYLLQRLKSIKFKVEKKVKKQYLKSELLLKKETSELSPKQKSAATVAINQQMNKIYSPQPYAGKVVLFRTTETQKRLERSSSFLDKKMGWGNLGVGDFVIYDLHTLHNDVFKEPYVELLGQYLNKNLVKTSIQLNN